MAQYDYIFNQNVSAVGEEFTSQAINLVKGDLLTVDSSYNLTTLTRGTDDQVLVSDASETSGLAWRDLSSLGTTTTPVSAGGTGVSSIDANCLISGNGTDPVTVESTLEAYSGRFILRYPSDPSNDYLVIGGHTKPFYIQGITDDGWTGQLILGANSTSPEKGIFIDKTNGLSSHSGWGRLGVFIESPDHDLDVCGDIGLRNSLIFTEPSAGDPAVSGTLNATRTIEIEGDSGYSLKVSAGDGVEYNGGKLSLIGGEGSSTSSTRDGGDIELTAGTGDGNGGSITIDAGTGATTGGNINISGGDNSYISEGGNVIIQSGGGYTSGDVIIKTVDAELTGDGDGGSIYITAGTGTNEDGVIYLGSDSSLSNHSDIYMKGIAASIISAGYIKIDTSGKLYYSAT